MGKAECPKSETSEIKLGKAVLVFIFDSQRDEAGLLFFVQKFQSKKKEVRQRVSSMVMNSGGHFPPRRSACCFCVLPFASRR